MQNPPEASGVPSTDASILTSLLPPPRPLDLSGDLEQAWKMWYEEFTLYSTATGLKAQDPAVTSATFLVTIGEDARRVYHTFTFANEADQHDLDTPIEKFHAHCKLTVNQTYREFVFGMRNLKPGEPVYVRNRASHQWAPAIVLARKQPRLYIVQDDEGLLHQRNRVVLRQSTRRAKPLARYTDPNFTT
ncbi:hypothetical protein IscW_ISCW008230 [Ixodes scapularis]|uniref:Uncharacterized protein n=1 Tax=Ixodes scapularis TaxID=6945 RepID=B7PS19_IXOSC|nr:hypothetical protein IscW_ISCW008230 [Ixodes scapularis]|eukprot:XP_002401773.1 hypothetical protein IscW_ISCW008230 [Ixodes scapularis]